MTYASLLIIMTADINAWKKKTEGYWENAPKDIVGLLVNWMTPFHEGREWMQHDEAQRSIGMAMQTLMLVQSIWAMVPAPWLVLILKKLRNSSTCLKIMWWARWLPFARGRKTYVLNQVSCHWMKWWLKTVFDGSDINQFDNYLTIVTIISR